MADGFRAVFDDLHQAANEIGDWVQGVAGLPWQGPSGDYGHAGVRAGWTQFIGDARAEVAQLAAKAGEHRDGLRAAAGRYLESDDESGFVVADLGTVLDSSGGFTGGISDVVGRATGEAGGRPGFVNPGVTARPDPDGGIASRLDPEGPLY
ncbi:MAG TPA: hypothetical protein VJT49_02565 [Amycolatopsis sp.]|uniref:hypothetical protein n=1 Tax=Amycolatopsis sp. TaxID=37632 RepID=UPI002B499BC5|nr:hypothetical protein [Amycolatopsis sp.]HKS43996.1 hypothetical protein [Amycolatopsis sp.]